MSKIKLNDRQLSVLIAVKRGAKTKVKQSYRTTEIRMPFTADRMTFWLANDTRGVVYQTLIFLFRLEMVKRMSIDRADAQYPTGPLPYLWELTDKGKAYLDRQSL